MLLLSQPALKLVYTATKITIILITTFSGTKLHFPKSNQFERGGVQESNLQKRSHLQSPRSNAARCLHRLKVKVKVRAAWRPQSAFPSHMSRARGPCQVAPQPVFVQEQSGARTRGSGDPSTEAQANSFVPHELSPTLTCHLQKFTSDPLLKVAKTLKRSRTTLLVCMN